MARAGTITIAWICLVALALPARAQRIIFPSTIAQDPAGWSAPTMPMAPPPPPTLPSFDPYAAPVAQPAPVYTPQPLSPGIIRPDGTVAPYQRFVEQIRFEGSYLPKLGTGGFGFNTLEISGSFAFPVFQRQPPFFVTPGFAVHYLDGPNSGAFPNNPDLPPRVYDTYLDTAWRPIVNERFSADLGFRIGLYTDYSFVDSRSLRYIGRGLGLYQLSPRWQIAAGVVYIDRNDIKLLPAGGLVWTPNPDTRWEIFFPRPKLANRWRTWRNTDIWVYLAGEYGGGAWRISRANGVKESFDYDDIRFYAGLETKGTGRLRTWIELGYVFARQVQYFTPPYPGFRPNETLMLRGGVAF